MRYLSKIKAFVNLAFRNNKLSFGPLQRALLVYLDFTVAKGPFANMKYIANSSGSTLVPKITGTYECELHEIITKINNRKPRAVIDIGCAEGYYAVGLAWLNKSNSERTVYAYDTNEEALLLLKSLANLNGVENKIIIKRWFDQFELEKIDAKDGIIICDVEGAEKDILDPDRNPKLLGFDILVEVHDGLNTTAIKDILVKRFTETHQVEEVNYSENHLIRTSYMPWVRNRKFIRHALNEGRRRGLVWLYFTKK